MLIPILTTLLTPLQHVTHATQVMLLSHLHLLASGGSPQPTPNAGGGQITDSTGIGQALEKLAQLFAGVIGGVVIFFIVINGFMYIFTAEESRGMYAKRAMGGLIFGTLLVALAATIGPAIVSAITGQ